MTSFTGILTRDRIGAAKQNRDKWRGYSSGSTFPIRSCPIFPRSEWRLTFRFGVRLNGMTPEQRQHAILEALYKRKNKPETDVETIRQESCGSVAPSVFMGDWKILLDNGFVVGLPTNDNNKIITGTGRITSRGEQEFKALKAAQDKKAK